MLGLLFSVGVLLLAKERYEKRSIGMIGAYCLILVSFLGLFTAIFNSDVAAILGFQEPVEEMGKF